MNNTKIIAGVDEVGRGPLAGPVVAAAVILDPDDPIKGLMDSKKLSAKKREELFVIICEKALAITIGQASPEEIDDINILQASLLAMKRAIDALPITPDEVLVDGTFCPDVNHHCQAIIKGDDKIPEISAASIIAKVTRDRFMAEEDAKYPGYGFAKHSGYPTKSHIAALQKLGVTPIHRKSFGPVSRLI